jgi:hypothetical protein
LSVGQNAGKDLSSFAQFPIVQSAQLKLRSSLMSTPHFLRTRRSNVICAIAAGNLFYIIKHGEAIGLIGQERGVD